ncbi:1-acyl-sn-glycerol-3-phosphate acyltransferase epsilon-like isoform X1 [Syngnathus acus]|uniref:1-acyl-sn-glycerol-3-phosphate acyltransferase epsilon-like isoform X1 n=2 Tax=Syngnathus acus TaxID=161584 RepID=UPI0018862494|nr:1-acyl-sn-glycerol-3-phosphate acyltransferase epsilon-like isoform X1 [Syngnathus acus]
MLLSFVVHTYSLRYWFPATVMLGTAPVYLLFWGAWRILSTLLPVRLYHTLDDRLYCIYQSMVLFFFENYTGVEIIIYGDIPKKKENVIYMSNHQCTADWIIADMLAIRQSALGHVRYVLKDGLKWLPLYGWYFSQHGGIYVKRSAKFNQEAMMKKLVSQNQSGAPMYLVIFPEGTRYNPELKNVITDSQAFATKEGLAVLRHTLTPRMKASHIALETMRGHLDAVYDVTVAYEGTLGADRQRKPAPSMPEFLCKECPRVHIHFERVHVKEIPPEPHFFRRWLHERFEIKDRFAMAIDWVGYGYAAAILLGGYMGYKRKGSVMSLMAGLVFGGLSAFGAYNISNKPTDIKVSLFASGLLAVVMGTRYKKSGKLLPAGIMTILSLLMVFRLLLVMVV